MIAKTVRIALMTAAAAALLLAADASAATVSSSFNVSASVTANCRIDAASDITIPAWDSTSGTNPTPATGTITVRCTKGTQYTIDLNGGTYVDVLTHTNGTDQLPFKLYEQDCSTSFTAVSAIAPNRSPQNRVICAGLDVSQAALLDVAPAGTYSKNVIVDVTF